MWYLFEQTVSDVWIVKTTDGEVNPVTRDTMRGKLENYGELANGHHLYKHNFDLTTELGIMPVTLHFTFKGETAIKAVIKDPVLGVLLIDNIRTFTLEDEE